VPQAAIRDGCDEATADSQTVAPKTVGYDTRATADYPAVVALLRNRGSGPFRVHCTGTLIAPNAVLTAAHCVCNFDDDQEARKGNECRVTTVTSSGGKEVALLDPSFHRVHFSHGLVREVQQIEVPDDYIGPAHKGSRADLALLILKEPVLDVAPVPINDIRKYATGQIARVIGYGRHSRLNAYGIPISTGVDTKTGIKFTGQLETAACDRTPKYPLICSVYDGNAPEPLRSNSCKGDSGGPLVADVDGKHVLVGVNSGSKTAETGLCDPGSYSYKTEVFAFRKWIKDTLDLHAPTKAQDDPRLRHGHALPSPSPLAGLENTRDRYLIQSNWIRLLKWGKCEYDVAVPSGVTTLRIGLTIGRSTTSQTRDSTPVYIKVIQPGADRKVVAKHFTLSSALPLAIENPVAGTWRIELGGPPDQELQLLATAF
jgi:hypothetical protein